MAVACYSITQGSGTIGDHCETEILVSLELQGIPRMIAQGKASKRKPCAYKHPLPSLALQLHHQFF